MALRVLLADNSETIKKAIQVTLQDYAIDLRVVNLGVDVLDVALKFKPDIIFVDILLQKKSGYEVARELKTHPQLSTSPIVLMWSGFMEFDEQKAKGSLADATLEKPFDAQMLRGVVQKLVNKTKTNPLSGFLDLPAMPPPDKAPPPVAKKHEDPLKELEKIKNESQKFAPPPAADDAEEFEIKPLSTPKPPPIPTPSVPVIAKPMAMEMDDELTKSFVLHLPEDAAMDDVSIEMGKIESIEDMNFLLNPQANAQPRNAVAQTPPPPAAPVPKATASIPMPPPPTPATPKAQAPQTSVDPQQIDPNQIERLVQEEVSKRIAEIIEKVAWQVIPELASQIIKKELDRLLKDSDSK
jgi:two-component system cell cycle response regulator